jgi:hypothetical protein
MGEKINKCRVLVGNPHKKRKLERTERRFENRIKINFNKEVGKCGLDSTMDTDERRALLNMIMEIVFPQKGEFIYCREIISFPKGITPLSYVGENNLSRTHNCGYQFLPE